MSFSMMFLWRTELFSYDAVSLVFQYEISSYLHSQRQKERKNGKEKGRKYENETSWANSK